MMGRNLWILHWAFMAAIIVYVFVGHVAFGGRETTSTPIHSGTAFAVLVAFSLLQIFIAHRFPDWMRIGPPHEASPEPYLRRRTTQLVITDGLIETVAVYGLVGLMVGFLEAWHFDTMAALAFVGLASVIPRISAWIQEYRNKRQREPGG